MMIFLGGICAVTFVVHPNVFHDVPRSLEATMTFAVARGPSDFLGPVGLVAILTGIVSVILGWRVRAARSWILCGVVLLVVGEIVFSILFFWPRNTIMFVEGTKVHPVGVVVPGGTLGEAGLGRGRRGLLLPGLLGLLPPSTLVPSGNSDGIGASRSQMAMALGIVEADRGALLASVRRHRSA